MESKRLVLATVLSVVVLFLYYSFFAPKPVKKEKAPAPKSIAEKTVPQKKKEVVLDENPKEIKEEAIVEADVLGAKREDVKVETNLFRATFDNKGAILKEFILKNYKDDKGQLLNLVPVDAKSRGGMPFSVAEFDPNRELDAHKINNSIFQVVKRGEDEGGKKIVEFLFSSSQTGIKVVKKFTFYPNSYAIGTEFKFYLNGQEIKEVPILFGPGLENNVDRKNRVMLQKIKLSAYNGVDIENFDLLKVKGESVEGGVEVAKGSFSGSQSDLQWFALHNTYFAAIFKSSNLKRVSYMINKFKKRVVEEKKEVEKKYHSVYVAAFNPTLIYLGPKDEGILKRTGELNGLMNLNEIVDYGFMSPIARILLKGINFVYKTILGSSNYGWAIILFTIFLKLILFPLTYSSSVSMAKMQAVQPKIKAIQKRYKGAKKDINQRQEMQKEVMALYKKEKINPAGGCLPVLLQIPILWAFFRMLSISITVRHEPWILWIKDLSIKDPLYVLPILMCLTQIATQKMNPSSANTQGPTKNMMYIMPIFITFMVMNFASGLNLYWVTSNLLQMVQQKIINKKVYSDVKEEQKQKKLEKRKKNKKNNTGV